MFIERDMVAFLCAHNRNAPVCDVHNTQYTHARAPAYARNPSMVYATDGSQKLYSIFMHLSIRSQWTIYLYEIYKCNTLRSIEKNPQISHNARLLFPPYLMGFYPVQIHITRYQSNDEKNRKKSYFRVITVKLNDKSSSYLYRGPWFLQISKYKSDTTRFSIKIRKISFKTIIEFWERMMRVCWASVGHWFSILHYEKPAVFSMLHSDKRGKRKRNKENTEYVDILFRKNEGSEYENREKERYLVWLLLWLENKAK